jgi:hypothetical protein
MAPILGGGAPMSIYRKSINGIFSDIHVHPAKAPREAPYKSAPKLSEAQLHAERAREEAAKSRRKRGEPLNVPLPRTLAWATRLPLDIQPHELIRLYARIANQLAGGWDEPDATRTYFEQLLISERKNRKGFPEQVESELLALRRHYMELHVEIDSAWHDIRKR